MLLLSSTTYAVEVSKAHNPAKQMITMSKADTLDMLKDAGIETSKVKMLDSGEMVQTEGEWLPLVVRIGSYGLRLAYHGAHHTFKYIGKSPHLQLNMWKHGVPGSGKTIFRIPWQWWRH